MNATLKGKADNLKNLAETIGSLTEENNKLQTKFEDLTAENKSLVDSLEHRIEQVAQLKSDLETVKFVSSRVLTLQRSSFCFSFSFIPHFTLPSLTSEWLSFASMNFTRARIS